MAKAATTSPRANAPDEDFKELLASGMLHALAGDAQAQAARGELAAGVIALVNHKSRQRGTDGKPLMVDMLTLSQATGKVAKTDLGRAIRQAMGWQVTAKADDKATLAAAENPTEETGSRRTKDMLLNHAIRTAKAITLLNNWLETKGQVDAQITWDNGARVWQAPWAALVPGQWEGEKGKPRPTPSKLAEKVPLRRAPYWPQLIANETPVKIAATLDAIEGAWRKLDDAKNKAKAKRAKAGPSAKDKKAILAGVSALVNLSGPMPDMGTGDDEGTKVYALCLHLANHYKAAYAKAWERVNRDGAASVTDAPAGDTAPATGDAPASDGDASQATPQAQPQASAKPPIRKARGR